MGRLAVEGHVEMTVQGSVVEIECDRIGKMERLVSFHYERCFSC